MNCLWVADRCQRQRVPRMNKVQKNMAKTVERMHTRAPFPLEIDWTLQRIRIATVNPNGGASHIMMGTRHIVIWSSSQSNPNRTNPATLLNSVNFITSALSASSQGSRQCSVQSFGLHMRCFGTQSSCN